ncbi:MAG: hypothetical protein JSR40_13840 [Proteobacteria bacterium]|nr:hypothetical protein [Pseudomonadota bacterium]
MEQAQSTNSTEQRRKLLKGALAASGVVSMGYSGAALASFQCISSTTVTTPAIKARFTAPTSASDLRYLKVPLYAYTADTSKACNNGQILKSYTYNSKQYSVLGGVQIVTNDTIYLALDDSQSSGAGAALLLANPITKGGICGNALSGQFIYLLAYFTQDGSYAGVYTNSAPVLSQPATGSCLSSLNPHLQVPGNITNTWFDG